MESYAGIIIVIICSAIFYVLINGEDKTKSTWQIFAQKNHLTFDKGNDPEDDCIYGIYRGYHLRLETFYRPHIHTRITLSSVAQSDKSSYQRLKKERQLNEAISAENNLLDWLSSIRKGSGYINADIGGEKLSYEEPNIKYGLENLQSCFDLLCDLADAYPGLKAIGGKAFPNLTKVAKSNKELRPFIIRLLQDIGDETRVLFADKSSNLLCPRCFVYCASHKVSISRQNIAFYGCRNCGQSDDFLEFGGSIVAVLDSRDKNQRLERDGELFINWFVHREMFDFDEVKINYATDEDVERFAVQLGNDTDSVRKLRYKNVHCCISPDCNLSENTKRILERIFGQVDEIQLQQQTEAI